MPKTREKKKKELSELQERFEKSKSIVFSTQTGISVHDMEKLRGELREQGGEIQTAKKTLLNILFKEKKVAFDISKVPGTFGIVYSYDDEVSAAKALYQFGKEHEGMKILGGILESEVIDAEKVATLANLPSKHELLAKTVRTIQAPVSSFVNVLAGTMRGFVQVLQSIKEAKQ